MPKTSHQRIVVGIFEGLGSSDFEASRLPAMKSMAARGFSKHVNCSTPANSLASLTSILCGSWPDAHGIVFDSPTAPVTKLNTQTLFQQAKANDIASALITSTQRTLDWFRDAVDIGIATGSHSPILNGQPRNAPTHVESKHNLWLWDSAIEVLVTRPDIKLLCVHTHDAPLHRWAPNQQESIEYRAQLDERLARAEETAPDAAFFLTATHGMNAKKRCWDLAKVCKTNGYPLKGFVIPEIESSKTGESIGTGCAWIGLEDPEDSTRVCEIIDSLEGVEAILTNSEAALRFHLPSNLPGDLMILGDQDTVFGELATPGADLAEDYRAHGSLHEADVPLIIYNYEGDLPHADWFKANKDLTRFLY